MNPSRIGICLLAVLLLTLSTLVSKNTSPDHEAIEADLANFYLEDAMLKVTKLSSPSYRNFYKTNIWVYKYFGSHDPAYLDSIQQNWKHINKEIEKLSDLDSIRDVLLAELAFKRSMLEFMDGNYFTAVRHAQRARSHIRKHASDFPHSIESRKIQGLFNVAFGSVPKKYQWLIRTFGYKGDVALGMKQITEAASESGLLRTEANLLAYYIKKNLLSKPKEAIRDLAAYQKEMSSSIVIDYFLATGFASLKENEKALAILRKGRAYKSDPKVFFISYWDYCYAKSFYFKEDYLSAQKLFTQFLNNHKGKIYRTDATFRLGMAYTLQDNYEKGKAHFMHLSNDESSFEEDEYAYHMSTAFRTHEPSQVVKLIFRARNLYDGGYLAKAEELLQGLDPSTMSLDERTELYYRYARIYHTLGNLDLASQNYEACIALEEGQQLWLQVYAHYFLAEIAKESKKYAEARDLYQKALSFDDYFYQSGMENRCKVALAEIKKK